MSFVRTTSGVSKSVRGGRGALEDPCTSYGSKNLTLFVSLVHNVVHAIVHGFV